MKRDLLGHSHFDLVDSMPFLLISNTIPKTDITRLSNPGESCCESLLPETVKPRSLTGEKEEGRRAGLEALKHFFKVLRDEDKLVPLYCGAEMT